MPPSRPRQSRPRSDVWSNSDWGLLPRDRNSLTIEPVLEAGHTTARGAAGLNPRPRISHVAPLRGSAAQSARPLDPPARSFALQAVAVHLALPPGLIAGLHASAWACGALPVAKSEHAAGNDSLPFHPGPRRDSPHRARRRTIAVSIPALTAVLTAVFLPLMLVVAQQVVGRLLA